MGVGKGPGRGSRRPRSPEHLVTIVVPQVTQVEASRIYKICSRNRKDLRKPIVFDSQITKDDLPAIRNPRFQRAVRRAINLEYDVYSRPMWHDFELFAVKKPVKDIN